MATITTRSGKGSPLTNTEVDDNFTNLNTDKIENVVEDSSPQLGGNLSLNGNNITGNGNITLGDSQYVAVGASNDLTAGYTSFYNFSYIDSASSLYLSSSGIMGFLKDNAPVSGGEYMAKFNPDGSCELYYDNAKKFETTSTGIDVTGEVQCDSLDVDGAIDLDITTSGDAIHLNSTASDGLTGPNITFNRTGNDEGGALEWVGGHQYAPFRYASIEGYRESASVPGYNGSVRFKNADVNTTTLTERMRMNQFGIVINEDGDAGTDFRVESDSNVAMLFVDASANAIGINNSTPSSELDVTGDVAVSGSVVSTIAINAQTGTTYTTVLADQCKLVTLTNASAITLTIPPNSSVAYPVGTKIDLAQLGAGQVTVAGGTGVTVNSTPTLKLRAQYSAASCIKTATDTWLLVGDLAES